MTKNLVILGTHAFAEIAWELFTNDSDYDVVAFSVNKNYIEGSTFHSLPVVPLENLSEHYDVHSTHFFAAIAYADLNRRREFLFQQAIKQGFLPASYISSKAILAKSSSIGEHCFIFEGNNIQPFVKIGNNVVLWSGNHIGHHSQIEDHVFVASQAVISGYCQIGAYSFIGVNATIANNVSVGESNWIGISATITKNTLPNQLFKGERSSPSEISSLDFFKVNR